MNFQPTQSLETADSFFNANFTTIYQSPHNVLWHERKVFLIGETPSDIDFRRSYSSLIDQMKKTHDVFVLVEGEKSMKKIEKSDSVQTFFLSSNIDVYGWDVSTAPEMYPSLPQIARCVNLYKKYQQRYLSVEKAKDCPEKSKKLKARCDKTLSKFKEIEKELRGNSEYKSLAEKHFIPRTNSMVETIQKITQTNPEAKIFVIAALRHVQQASYNSEQFSLSSLYQHLDTIESIALIKNLNTECFIC